MPNHTNSLLSIRPERLRCEHLADPQGIDVRQPRLSWLIAGGGQGAEVRGLKQTAYHILVANSEELLARDQGNLWDSGEVCSDQATFIVYEGLPLRSRMRCYWKVKARLSSSGDPDVAPPAWSDVASWSMGLLVPDDWCAQWIGSPTAAQVEPAPLLRKAFVLEKPITRATAYLSGLGYYELSLNGEKVGDRMLDPKVTRYERRVLYATYDVTAQVRDGENVLGVMLGNGWYNYHVKNPWHFDEAPWRDTPRLLCQLELEFADGSIQVIVSDGSWQHATGAVRFDGLLNGEEYDARLEKDGWDTAGFDASGWAAAKVVDAPMGRLVAQMIEPIRIIEVIKPVKLTQPKPGVYLYDLGQNMAGAARLTVMGPAGTDVRIQYAELLHSDGTLDPTNIDTFCESGDFQTEHYILKGKGIETWQARFMYYGFQYVQVTGFPGEPTLDSLVGLVMHTDVATVGGFACSNELLNKINHCNLWSYLNNFHGYPTDCPHREKIGWTGDAHIAGATGLYNFDPMAVFTEWLRDFADEQQPNGELPGIIPTGGWGYERWGGPAWCSAFILIPWYMYRYRGDVRILAEHYENMKRYVNYLTASSPGGINEQGMGDWFPAKTETPVNITSTSYYYIDAVILSQIAEILGRREDAARYASLAADVRLAFNQKFFDQDTGQYGGGTQTANSCGIYQGLVGPPDLARVAENLAESIANNDRHLDCGILGAKYVLHALADNGYVDLAYQVAAQTTWPSWGDMVRQGATTLWEGWDAAVGTHNHVMLGDISAWFFETLAGIKCDARGPGFKKIIIQPRPAGDLSWVMAHHDSLHGRIVSNWKREGSKLLMDVTIPINTTATVHVPTSDSAGITESGNPAGQSAGVKFLRMENGAAVYEVASGCYQFTSQPPVVLAGGHRP
jgi:alpha-L-rhamnosidase